MIPLFELNSSRLSLQDDDLRRILDIARAELAAGHSTRLSAHHPLTSEETWAVTLTLDAQELLTALDGFADVLTGVMPVIRAAVGVVMEGSVPTLAALETAVQALATPQDAGWL